MFSEDELPLVLIYVLTECLFASSGVSLGPTSAVAHDLTRDEEHERRSRSEIPPVLDNPYETGKNL